ncbi:hemerythrin domain-containing protein [Hyalangium gracile]|uniref:hemerythrin domain-containing protein n=1 Tax=Hyalangium gracile TaxID=394092 RepID=UPI001CCADA82|nr:hemerythrin domain-containing protein [Hyalangium gracile]
MGPFDILAEQHRKLQERLESFEPAEGPGEPDTQRERVEALVELLQLHAWLEERHLLPLLARVEGRVRARQEAEDHLTMRELVEELETLEPETDEWWARLVALEDVVAAHAREEETETFPRLASTLDTEEQQELSQAFLGAPQQLRSWASPLSGTEPSLADSRGDA